MWQKKSLRAMSSAKHYKELCVAAIDKKITEKVSKWSEHQIAINAIRKVKSEMYTQRTTTMLMIFKILISRKGKVQLNRSTTSPRIHFMFTYIQR